MATIEEIIQEYRTKRIEGQVIDLVPLSEKELPDIVRMRNTPKMKYFFNQEYDLTLEMQRNWFIKYLDRKDDIYWAIYSKDGRCIGANRIYDVTAQSCDQGSIMVDSQESMGGPVAAEAMLLSLEFAFDVLKVERIFNDDRHDNKNMNSISKRFGFKYYHDVDIRGVQYRHYELEEKDFKRKKIQSLIDMWVER